MTIYPFDVFLAHNHKDKPLVRKIYLRLQDREIHPWLDEMEIPPGASFQTEIQKAIGQIKTAAICIGEGGLGQWQALELKSLISQCIERNIPIIPVLLPGVTEIPTDLIFLKEYHSVTFNHIEDEQAFAHLEWGITQKKLSYELTGSTPSATLTSQLDNEENVSDIDTLVDLLSSAKLKQADKQTKKIILSGNSGNLLTTPVIRELPLEPLATVDQLWMKYSNGRFGLKAQCRIWQKCLERQKPRFNPFAQSVPVTEKDAWNQLGCLVGWRDEEKKALPDAKIEFSMEAPPGCFPQTRRWLHGGFGNDINQFVALIERIAKLE